MSEGTLIKNWRDGLDSRVIATLEVIYKHRDGRCNAVIANEGGRLECIHLQREIAPEIVAAIDAASGRVGIEMEP